MIMDYVKVAEAFKSGEIDPDKWTVIWDNDDGYWMYNDRDEVTDDEYELMCEHMASTYGVPGGYRDVVEVANAAGIPSDWC